ncbi:RNA polymerase II transcription factor B subunit 4 [Olea europaea subsp. europaea]|uniref:General transcription and DNA repair factor IIH subunit TFB4 n=1 Tax=Olea europaea subsp. europaea TaxID=158383 RepID=A0A8S0PRH7_OLEEU|nr:RNA polymerase II transcription factor B subunit 4 [Olea europaea subsp. europaea]
MTPVASKLYTDVVSLLMGTIPVTTFFIPQPRRIITKEQRVCCRNWRSLWRKTSHCVAKTLLMALDFLFFQAPFPWLSATYRRCFGQDHFIHGLGYVAIMNAIFSAQRLMVPVDSCILGAQHSAFLQQGCIFLRQASYITGGVYLKPQQLDGLFQYLSTVFATDLHSRSFLQLPKPVGVDFRAACFCHKNTIDMGYICSVCLSIFCKHHKQCSTCGSVFG